VDDPRPLTATTAEPPAPAGSGSPAAGAPAAATASAASAAAVSVPAVVTASATAVSVPGVATASAVSVPAVAETEAHRRYARWWEGYFLVVAVAVAAAILVAANGALPRRLVAVGAMAAMVLLHVVAGSRVTRKHREDGPSFAVAAGHLLLFSAAVAASPVATWLLFAVIPMFFQLVSVRAAIVLVVVVNLITPAVDLFSGSDQLTMDLIIAVISAAGGIWLGFWIIRLIEQNTERGNLIRELSASRAEVARLSHEAGVAAERARLAGEIHDTLAQGFTSIITLLQAVDPALRDERLALAVRTARENLAESRALVAALAPAALSAGSLPDSVRRQAARFAEETGTAATVRVTGDERALPTTVEVVLLRAAGGPDQRPPARRCRRDHGAARLRARGGAAGGARRRLRVRPGGCRRVRAERDAGPRRTGGRDAGRAQRPGPRHHDRGGGAGVIRILLVDDHPVVRHGVRGMLDAEPDLTVVGEASSGPAGVELAVAERPDIVLMDLRMPGGDGVSATAEILARVPGVRVVVLTTYETDRDILRAIEAGACGYLLKDASPGELAGAVRAAHRGETVLAPSVASTLVRQVRQPAPPALSAREAEVLKLVARGLTNADIGRELFIAEATVKTHLLRVFAKLEVADRTAAVTTAMQHGLL
jgi:DNA-binding NarL/FixJ family response regulator/signal transduction histidine kinase